MSINALQPRIAFDPDTIVLETPMIQNLRDQLHRTILTGRSGANFMGMPRVGKTWALEQIEGTLVDRMNRPVPTLFVTMPSMTNPSIKQVHFTLCADLDLKPSASAKEKPLLISLAMAIGEKAKKTNSKSVVLLVDEIQNLAPEQFEALSDLFNQVALLKVKLILITMGNACEKGKKLLKALKHKNYKHIRGRFFVDSYEFSGIRSVEELKACLASYDNSPHERGKSVLQLAVPEAYLSGWRLEAKADEIWAVYAKYQKALELDCWPMQFFTAAITLLLMDMLPYFGVSGKTSLSSMIHQCIDASGLLEFNAIMEDENEHG